MLQFLFYINPVSLVNINLGPEINKKDSTPDTCVPTDMLAHQKRYDQVPLASALNTVCSVTETESAWTVEEVKSGMGSLSPDWRVTTFNIHLQNQRFLLIYPPGHAGITRNDQADRLADKAAKIWSVEELETLPEGTKQRTSHHQDRLSNNMW